MAASDSPTFGVLLRQYRHAARLSQEALAERAGISADAVAALERGRRMRPHPDTLTLLVSALQLTAEDRATLVAAIVDDAPTGSVAPQRRALPVPPTPMIGRDREEAAIVALLQRANGPRVITLTGPGGVGKTRLALAVAGAVGESYPDGVTFMDLSAIRDPELVAAAMARALGLREDGARRPRELLLTSLHEKCALLVLDNFEQVVDAAPLVAALVAAAPRLVVLVTSRIPLRIQAEQQFPVPPLVAPAPNNRNAGNVMDHPAVQLFMARARAALSTFDPDAENIVAVAEICRRLDGLPLAIELAAARVALLSPVTLLALLGRRPGVLKAKARDLPERQQTLGATIDWSYALLSEEERALFRCLGLFASGGTLDAVEAVALPQAARDGDIMIGVETLVDHNLLRREEQPGDEPRFRMLETIREYARERLVAEGEERAARNAHAAYYLALAEEARPRLFGADQMLWLERLDREHDNLRAALAWAQEEQDAERSLRLAGALWRFWYIRCYLSEGRGWLQTCIALSAPVAATVARTDALVGLAVIAYAQTDYDRAATAAAESAALARTRDDRPNLALSLNILGGVARYRSDFGLAAALGEECVALTRSIGDRWTLALSLHNLADVARLQGAYERATALATESLSLARTLSDRWGIAQALITMGQIAHDADDADDAARLFAESLAIVRELGHTRDIALALVGLGEVTRVCGDIGGGAALLEESLALLRPLGDKIRLIQVLNALGRARHAQGKDMEAACLFRESLPLSQEVNNRLGIVEGLEGMAAVAAQAMTPDHAEAAERTTRLLAAATALREAIGASLARAERISQERIVGSARATLGETRFAAMWAIGRALTINEILADALGQEGGVRDSQRTARVGE